MSVKQWAIDELQRSKFPPDEVEAMKRILDIFFDTWDSGGAVSVMVPVLHRLLCVAPLSPLTGDHDEWNDVTDVCIGPEPSGVIIFQNRRCSSVFRRFDGEMVMNYDQNLPGDDHFRFGLIKFPYMPEARVINPVMVFETNGA